MPGAATAKALSPKEFAVLKTELRKKSSLFICEKKAETIQIVAYTFNFA